MATLPTVAHHAAVFTANRLHDAVFGPIVTHAIALVPSVIFGVSTIKAMVVSALVPIRRQQTPEAV